MAIGYNKQKLVSLTALVIIAVTGSVTFVVQPREESISSSGYPDIKGVQLTTTNDNFHVYYPISNLKVNLAPTIQSISNKSGQVKNIKFGSFSFAKQEVVSLQTNYRFAAYAFVWDKGDFSYSFDGVNFQQPETLGEDTPDNFHKQASTLTFTSNPFTKVYIKTTNVENLTLSLITPSESPQYSLTGITSAYSGATYTSMSIISRKQWGADENVALWKPSYAANTKRVIVHHTDGDNSSPDYAAVVRGIFNYHTVTLDWGDIGYNYLIAPNGVIYEGRKGGEGVIAAHTYQHNTGSIGISMIGNYSSILPTDAALGSLQYLIAEKSIMHNLQVVWGTDFYGHRDFNPTACPGQTLFNFLPTRVTYIQGLKDAPQFTALKNAIADATTKFQSLSRSGTVVNDIEVTFNRPDTSTPDQIAALLPKYSGIESYSITGNKAYLHLYQYYDNSEIDYTRNKLLFALFSLDNDVSSVKFVAPYKLGV